MTKRELDLLERAFAAEIEFRLPYQTKSKLAKRLASEGYLVEIERTFGKDCFGPITAKGYALTIMGNLAYCTSDRCKEATP